MRKLRMTLAVVAAAALWAGNATAGIMFTDTSPRSVLIETEGAKGSCNGLLQEFASFTAPPFLPPHPNSRLATPDCIVFGADPASGIPDYTNQADDYFGVLTKLPPGTAPNLPGGGTDPWRVTVPAPVWTAALTRTLGQANASFTALKATLIVDFDRSNGNVAPGNVVNAQCTGVPSLLDDSDTCCTGAGAGTCAAVYYEATGLRPGLPIRLTGQSLPADYPFFGNADQENLLPPSPVPDTRGAGRACLAAGFPNTCCTGVGVGDGTGYCALLLPDPGAPLALSCSAAAAQTTAVVGTGTISAVVVNGDGSTTLTTTIGTLPGGEAATHVLEVTAPGSSPILGRDYDIVSVAGAGATIVTDEGINPPPFAMAASNFAIGDTISVRNFSPLVGGTLYGPPNPGSAAVPTNANPCNSTLIPNPGFADLVGGTDTMVSALAAARITLVHGAGFVLPEPAGTPASWAPLDWRLSETTDTDFDGVPDPIDNCTTLAQVSGVPTGAIPGNCDRDKDGIGNACDGDFSQSYTTGGEDFSPLFLSAFTAGTDTAGNGTDMNCGNTVGGEDFSPLFLNQFTSGTPGPSGFACAASFAANPISLCTAAGVPFPCCTGFQTGTPGDNVIQQFCACP